MIDPLRTAEYHQVVARLAAWAPSCRDIRGVAVVGSWARDEASMTSDVDLVVLAQDPTRYLTDDGWLSRALGQQVAVVRRRQWGVLTERRARLDSGLEVDIGMAPVGWASVTPVDAGTAAVVRQGCRPITDPDGLFAQLVQAVNRPSPDPPPCSGGPLSE